MVENLPGRAGGWRTPGGKEPKEGRGTEREREERKETRKRERGHDRRKYFRGENLNCVI